jgi:hypothetical protein
MGVTGKLCVAQTYGAGEVTAKMKLQNCIAFIQDLMLTTWDWK